jgi:hypothetical protein
MRKWGIILSIFYVLVVLGFLLPAAVLLVAPEFPLWSNFVAAMGDTLSNWLTWIPLVAVAGGQALLLFLSVDTTQKRLKPRAHIWVSCTVTGLLLALLTFAAVLSFGVGFRGDDFLDFLDRPTNSGAWILVVCALLWLLWGIVFYRSARNTSDWLTRATSWLLRGSVLELLVAVPAHVLVRRRHDCSAPIATSFGITTGIAIMLLSFGPSVLFLFKKRMEAANGTRRRATP